jgi:hypothetical protein
MLGTVSAELIAYGVVLTIAWLINFVSVPAYFGNFIEGKLWRNRTSQLLMLIALPLVAIPSGMFSGGIGVVVSTAAVISIGSLYVMGSRGRELAARLVIFTAEDLTINASGLTVAGSSLYLGLSWPATLAEVLIAAAVLLTYLSLTLPIVFRLFHEHLRCVSGVQATLD